MAALLLIGTAKDPKDMQETMADIQPHVVQLSGMVFEKVFFSGNVCY